MGTTAQKLSYLNETKTKLKDMINYGLDDNNKITSSTTFRNYVSSIFNAFLEALRTPDTLFTNLPKKSGSGSNIILNDTANAPMRIELGASELTQNTTIGKNLISSFRASGNAYINYNIDTSGLTATMTYSFTPNVSATNTKLYIRSISTNYIYDKVTFNLVANQKNTVTFTLTATEITNLKSEASMIQLYRASAGWTNPTLTEPQLESGSTATSWEEYTGGMASPNPDYPQEVKVVKGDNVIKIEGKNLFDSALENGSFDGNGAKSYSLVNYRNVNIIPVKPNTTYTFSINGTSQKYCTYYYDENKTFLDMNLSLTTGTFTTPNNCYYLNIRCFQADYTDNFASLKLQLEKGNQATTYEPYTSQEADIDLGDIEYCKIGNYEDKIFKNIPAFSEYDSNLIEGAWYIKKNIGKVVLDGTESGWANMYTNNQGLGTITVDLDNLVYQSNNSGLSNYFIYKWVYNNPKPCFYVYNQGDVGRIMFVTQFTQKQDFIDWLVTHNINAYYILATPTYTQITGTLANQLENVYKNMLSQKGVTNISQVNNDLPFEMSVSALESI